MGECWHYGERRCSGNRGHAALSQIRRRTAGTSEEIGSGPAHWNARRYRPGGSVLRAKGVVLYHGTDAICLWWAITVLAECLRSKAMTIHYSVSDRIATVTLDRPEALNALDLESLKELRAVLAEARDDEEVRVIVLTGAGRKSFC